MVLCAKSQILADGSGDQEDPLIVRGNRDVDLWKMSINFWRL